MFFCERHYFESTIKVLFQRLHKQNTVPMVEKRYAATNGSLTENIISPAIKSSTD